MSRPPLLARLLLGVMLRGEAREVIGGDLLQEWKAMRRHGVHTRFANRWYWRQVIGSIWVRRPWIGPSASAGRGGAGSLIGSLWYDLRYGWKALLSQPMVTAISVSTLAVGLGAAAAVSAIGVSLLAPPIPGAYEPKNLMDVRSLTRHERGWQPRWLRPYQFESLFDSVPTLETIAGVGLGSANVSRANGDAELLNMTHSTWRYFSVLGMVPQVGRLWSVTDDTPGAPVAVVISDQLWSRWYSRSSEAVGSSLSLNGIEATVVGVAPPGFRGLPSFGRDVDVWITGSSDQVVQRFEPDSEGLASRSRYYMFVARARPGASAVTVSEQLTLQLENIRQSSPEESERLAGAAIEAAERLSVYVDARPRVRETLGLMYVIVIAVLLTGTANVSNLLLLRGLRRRGEIALRLALGASRWRVARAQLMESFLLATTGGVVGLFLGLGLTRLADGLTLGPAVAVGTPVVDWRTFGLVTVAAVMTAVLAGSIPAMVAGRSESRPFSQGASRTMSRRPSVFSNGFTMLQMIVSALLLSGALLFVQTLRNLTDVSLSFEPGGVTTYGVVPGSQGYSRERMESYHRSLIGNLSSAPGIEHASLSTVIPMNMYMLGRAFRPDQSEDDGTPVYLNSVTPAYFEAFGIPIVGRTFRDDEVWTASGGAPVIISASVAREVFSDSLPIGRSMRVNWDDERRWTVIGVVPDLRSQSPRWPAEAVVYFPFTQVTAALQRARIAVRSSLPPLDVDQIVQTAARRADPSLPLYDMQRMTDLIAERVSEDRMFAQSMAGLALLAIFLSAVGVYGVAAFGAAERAREFGIRQALGATPTGILRLVLRESGVLATTAVIIGLVLAALLSRLVESRLFGVDALQPGMYVTTAAALIAVALIASLNPARRSTRVDPVAILRYD